MLKLAKICAIFNFAKHTVTIDHVELPTRTHDELMDIKSLNTQFMELLESIVLKEATNCAVEILNAKYGKEDLTLIIDQICTHLSASQQEQLLKLLLDYDKLFGDTLGDW